jgi:transcriptional regulator GlxA family with amidase domain
MADRESNLQLAQLWVALEEIRKRIDNEAIPLGMHLGLEDPELMQALQTLSERIGKHLGRSRLVAEPRKKKIR